MQHSTNYLGYRSECQHQALASSQRGDTVFVERISAFLTLPAPHGGFQDPRTDGDSEERRRSTLQQISPPERWNFDEKEGVFLSVE